LAGDITRYATTQRQKTGVASIPRRGAKSNEIWIERATAILTWFLNVA